MLELNVGAEFDKQSSNDPCVYTFPGGVLVGVYVDDIVICGESTDHNYQQDKCAKNLRSRI